MSSYDSAETRTISPELAKEAQDLLERHIATAQIDVSKAENLSALVDDVVDNTIKKNEKLAPHAEGLRQYLKEYVPLARAKEGWLSRGWRKIREVASGIWNHKGKILLGLIAAGVAAYFLYANRHDILGEAYKEQSKATQSTMEKAMDGDAPARGPDLPPDPTATKTGGTESRVQGTGVISGATEPAVKPDLPAAPAGGAGKVEVMPKVPPSGPPPLGFGSGTPK